MENLYAPGGGKAALRRLSQTLYNEVCLVCLEVYLYGLPYSAIVYTSPHLNVKGVCLLYTLCKHLRNIMATNIININSTVRDELIIAYRSRRKTIWLVVLRLIVLKFDT
jgi:hypothetical protein